MGVDGSVVPCHPPCSSPYYSGTALLSAADIVHIYTKKTGGIKKKKSVAKIEPGPTLLRHKLQLAHTM